MRLPRTLTYIAGLAAGLAPMQASVAGQTEALSLKLGAVEHLGTARLFGRVQDASTGRPVEAVSVTVSATSQSTLTDADGYYELRDVPSGEQIISFHKAGYAYDTSQTRLPSGGEAVLDYRIKERSEDVFGEVIMLAALMVEATQSRDSNIGLMDVRREASVLSNAIGAETFSLQGISDAAEALGRLPGTSVVDGKYVLIRGMGDRYSSTLINNVTAPSADPDKRAVQMDQFPTDLLESIETSKSFTPDQPGAFSGGSVNIRTKGFPEGFFATVSVSTSYNSQSTGEDILTSGKGVDAFAMGSEDRKAPSIPDIAFYDRSFGDWLSMSAGGITDQLLRRAAIEGDTAPLETLDRFARGFQQDFYPRTRTADPGYGLAVAFGDTILLKGEQQLGYTFSLTYDRSNSHFDNGVLARYAPGNLAPGRNPTARRIFSTDTSAFTFEDALSDSDFPWGEDTPFGYTRSQQTAALGAFAKIAYKPSDNHELTLDILRNQMAEDTVQRGFGEERENSDGRIFQNYSLLYTERSITSVALSGKSQFENLLDSTLDWRAAWSNSSQDQPDYRIVETLYEPYVGEFQAQGVFDPSRFFRYLDETNKELGADLAIPLERFSGELKLGGVVTLTERTYEDDRYTLWYGPTENPADPSPFGPVRRIAGPNAWERLQNMYRPGNVGVTDFDNAGGRYPFELGWWPKIESTYTSNYEGEQDVWATYAMADFQVLPRLRVIGGARLEHTTLDVDSFDNKGQLSPGSSQDAEIEQDDILPALSLVYSLTKDMNLRLAYGRTIARPTLKELSSGQIFDPFSGDIYQGNPELDLAEINNFDLRWEWFRDRGQLVAISAFYKDMKNPIEVLLDTGAGVALTRPQNVPEGELLGVEIELRYDLGNLWSVLDGLSLGGNLSLVDAEVSIPEEELAFSRDPNRGGDPSFAAHRSLLGQSDLILNLDLTYQNFAHDLSASLIYNYVGERLAYVTLGTLPDVYEQPAPMLNLVISKGLWSGWKLKFKAANLLDPDIEQTIQLSEGQTLVWERYKRGRTFSLSLSHSF